MTMPIIFYPYIFNSNYAPDHGKYYWDAWPLLLTRRGTKKKTKALSWFVWSDPPSSQCKVLPKKEKNIRKEMHAISISNKFNERSRAGIKSCLSRNQVIWKWKIFNKDHLRLHFQDCHFLIWLIYGPALLGVFGRWKD
jgi:hypothetical protein